MGKRKRLTPKPRKTSTSLTKTIVKGKTPLLEIRPYHEYTGAQINAANAGVEFIKLTDESENHNGFQFKTGENRDTVPFYNTGSCNAGGLYFCKKTDAYQWLQYNCRQMRYVRRVTLPDDARVYVEDHKMKADKFVLGERETIFDNRAFFDYILQHHDGQFDNSTYFQFDASFYDEHAWKIILKKDNYLNVYKIPEELVTAAFRESIVRTIGDNSLTLGEMLYLINDTDAVRTDAVIQKLIANGLLFMDVPSSCNRRQALRCFLRMGKLEEAAQFPSSLFCDDTLLDGIRPTRAMTALVDKKKHALMM